MIVKLFDGTEFDVTKQQAEQVKQMISQGKRTIVIGESWLKSSSIAVIRPGGKTEADTVPDNRKIEARTDHRGEHSPAKERLRQWITNKQS